MKEKKGIIITVAVAVIVLGVLAYALASRQKANEPKTAGNQETVKMTETAASESAVSPADSCHGGDTGEGHLSGLFPCRSRDQWKRY